MQLVVSPIVVCPPHLKSPLSTTHGKQEAVCNPLKLEYARLSLTGTVGGGISKASLDGVSFHCAPSFYFLHYFRIIFSFDFYIFKSFLGHSDQNTFFFFSLATSSCVRVSLFPPSSGKRSKKNQRGWFVDDFTVTCAHGFYSTKTTRRSRSNPRFCFGLYLFFVFFLLSCPSRVDAVIIRSSLGECNKKENLAGFLFQRERHKGWGIRRCVWTHGCWHRQALVVEAYRPGLQERHRGGFPAGTCCARISCTGSTDAVIYLLVMQM